MSPTAVTCCSDGITAGSRQATVSLTKRPSAEPVNRAAMCYLRFAGARRARLDFFTIGDCAASAVCGASRLLAPPRFVVHQESRAPRPTSGPRPLHAGSRSPPRFHRPVREYDRSMSDPCLPPCRTDASVVRAYQRFGTVACPAAVDDGDLKRIGLEEDLVLVPSC